MRIPTTLGTKYEDWILGSLGFVAGYSAKCEVVRSLCMRGSVGSPRLRRKSRVVKSRGRSRITAGKGQGRVTAGSLKAGTGSCHCTRKRDRVTAEESIRCLNMLVLECAIS